MAATVGLALAASGIGAWVAQTAQAHGANASPGSRTYLCFQDSHWTGGDLDARNPACKQAIAEGGKQPLWDWPGVGNSATKGRTRGFIPDGKICSANNKTYAAYDAARADWPTTHLTSGAPWNFRFPSHDGHPGTFYLYITKDGYDPTKPLAWDDLEDKPFDTHTFQSPNASGSDGREFDWGITLPAHKSGRHLLLTFWQRSDADGAFFSCSDVVFDGGTGQVSGYPNSNEWKGTEPAPTASATGTTRPTATPTATIPTATTPTAPATPTTAPTTTSAPPDPAPSGTPTGTTPAGSCTAQINQVVWPTVHLTTLTLLNGSTPVDGWKVTFDAGSGNLLAGFNAGVSRSGSRFTATAPDWNPALSAGEEVSFGFVQEGSPTPAPANVALNGSACTVTGVTTQPADGSAPTGTTAPTTTAPAPTGSVPPTGTPAPTGTATTLPANTLFHETFEDGKLTEWSGNGGAWTIMKGSWTIANVLQQTDQRTAFTQKVAGPVSWKDYSVEVHLRAADCGRPRCALGIAARVNGASGARLVLYPGYGGQLQVVRNGKVQVAASVPFDLRLKQWRIVKLVVQGQKVTAVVDGTVIGTATGIPATGKVGILTASTAASFDNIDVVKLG